MNCTEEMKIGDLVMVREEVRRPQDENSIGLIYENSEGDLMIFWNDEEPEALDYYNDELEVINENR